MTSEKQKQFLHLLSCDKYRLEESTGKILSYRRKLNAWLPMVGIEMKGGYIQYTLRNKDVKVVIYGHIATWLACYGEYDPKILIKHKNGDRGDNGRLNLYMDIDDDEVDMDPKFKMRMIREKEIKDIREMVEDGFGPSEIAEQLVLNRSSVSVTIKKIKAGYDFRFENVKTGLQKRIEAYDKKLTNANEVLKKL